MRPKVLITGGAGFTGSHGGGAWERAVSGYIAPYDGFSEIQDQQSRPLEQLETMDVA